MASLCYISALTTFLGLTFNFVLAFPCHLCLFHWLFSPPDSSVPLIQSLTLAFPLVCPLLVLPSNPWSPIFNCLLDISPWKLKPHCKLHISSTHCFSLLRRFLSEIEAELTVLWAVFQLIMCSCYQTKSVWFQSPCDFYHLPPLREKQGSAVGFNAEVWRPVGHFWTCSLVSSLKLHVME